jgi:plastocyanin
MKKLIAAFVLLTLVTMLVVACGSSSTSSSSDGATVHMGDQNFLQPSVTISKGSNLTLVDDTATVHIIANGTWVNGNPHPMQENGAPVVNNLQFNGNDTKTIGPFNTAGTFHLYCTVHPNMNLTVVVQ